MESKKFYWLKLKKDFFKRHDIRIIAGMPEGEQIVLFYLKLMLESIDHDGELRFSEKISYTPEMLSVVTETEIEVVENGIEALEGLGLLEQNDDGTFILPKVAGMIGSASDTDEARRSRRYREKKKAERDETSHENVTDVTEGVTNRHESKSKSKSKSKSIDIPPISPKPTLEEVKAYCQERNNNVDPERWFNYYTSNGWKVGRNPMKDWKAAVRTWERDDRPQTIPKKEETFTDLIERWESEENG